jgi:AcrR family transcriptional regulator
MARKDGRSRVLTALNTLLPRTSIERLSIREVARHAKVSHTLPGYYFGDKRGLLTAFATDGWRMLAQQIKATLEEGAKEKHYQKLARIGQAYVKFAIRHPNHFFMMFHYHGINSEDRELRRHSDMVLEALSNTIDAYFTKPPDARRRRTTILAAWAIAHGLSMLMTGPPGSIRVRFPDPDAEADTITNEFASKFLPPRRGY